MTDITQIVAKPILMPDFTLEARGEAIPIPSPDQWPRFTPCRRTWTLTVKGDSVYEFDDATLEILASAIGNQIRATLLDCRTGSA